MSRKVKVKISDRKKKKLKPDSKSRLKNITRKKKSHVFFKSEAKII